MTENRPEPDKEPPLSVIKIIALVYAVFFIVRVLLVEAYQIPSQSMVPSLLVNDSILVDKLTRGPVLPFLRWKIPGIVKPKKNDIIVFIHPGWISPGLFQEVVSTLSLYVVNLDNTFDSPKNLVKRLVGMPGDRILMTNRTLVVNGKVLRKQYIRNAQEYLYDRSERKTGTMDFDIFEETDGDVKRIVQHLTPFALNFSGMRVPSGMLFFPEIVVPKKGDVIVIRDLNDYNKSLVKLLVEREAKKVVTLSKGKFFIEGKEITEWKVGDDYYFGMGDNRDMSEDSRFFGFIPGRNIFGSPICRFWPYSRVHFDLNEKRDKIRKKNYF